MFLRVKYNKQISSKIQALPQSSFREVQSLQTYTNLAISTLKPLALQAEGQEATYCSTSPSNHCTKFKHQNVNSLRAVQRYRPTT